MRCVPKFLVSAVVVLIIFLLIGIGSIIYSRSSKKSDTVVSTTNTQQTQEFNLQFTPYEGEQKGISIRALLSTIIANNAMHGEENGKKVTITVNIGKLQNGTSSKEILKEKDISDILKEIEISNIYYVRFTEYKNGLISNIEITD